MNKIKLVLWTIFCAGVFANGCAEEVATELGEQLQKTLTSESNKLGKEKAEERFATSSLSELKPITDPVFLDLERFEKPIVEAFKRSARKMNSEFVTDDLLPTQEKLLIFAGKGFDTQQFEKNSDGKLIVDYHYHVASFFSRPLPPESRDVIDLEGDDLKDNRDMIFHSPTTLLNKKNLEKVDSSTSEEPTAPNDTIELNAIAQTKILMDQNPELMLALRRDDSSIIDLLAEEEELNWKHYYGR